MEKQTSKRGQPKKVLETNLLQMNQNDCSGLIGGIVEKGFSDKPQSNPVYYSLPKPTVLPFPIAHHRSHGPHWRPMSVKRGGDSNDDSDSNVEDDEEEKAFMESDPVAAFANPVRRRRKKELEFSKWKEIILDDSSSKDSKEDTSCPRETKGKTKDEASKTADKRTSLSVDKSSFASMKVDAKLQSQNLDGGFINSVTAMELDNSSQLGFQKKVKDCPDVLRPEKNILISSMAYCSNSSNFKNEQESLTLESQIDAENRSRIEQMSAEEIAEAQAEIMEKLNPTLLKLLQKRGQEKINKKDQSISEVGNGYRSVDLQVENSQNAKHLLHKVSDFSTTVTTPPLENTDNKPDDKKNMTKTSTTKSSSSWDVWSDRVEAVRELRFSLEGEVIENDTAGVSMNVEHAADNVIERDFLRTEGDPAAGGYTIKEAVALSRSVVPAQRTLAWHILFSVLERALHNICKDHPGHSVRNGNRADKSFDWEAVWAFAFGSEPELILSLRICLDDNHYSVVLACAKVVQCMLSCDGNEKFFDVAEKIATCDKDICTAPVFRRKSDIDDGFFHGGFWKYSAKPSNILPFSEDSMDDETEGKYTIEDDIVVGRQDFTAGLVRMGILPKLCYLLETDPTMALEECVISILVAIARHSPSCANAILECPRLIQTIVHRFTVDNMEVRYSMIKFVILLKVLARVDQKNCLEFLKNGYFQIMTWHLYNFPSSVDHWVKLGKEKCKLSSALIVEQMRFWKVCVQYGYCVSNFSDLFPALCLWLNPPSFKKLTENNVLSEFTSLSSEAYLVLESLARRLPIFFSQQQLISHQFPEDTGNDREVWSWSYVTPMVDLALKWMATRNDSEVTRLFEEQKGRGDFPFQDVSVTPLLWVYAAATHMLFRVLERITPEDTISIHVTGRLVPWLPEFVPKIGLELVKYWLLGFSVSYGTECRRDPDGDEPFIKELIYLRQKNDQEMSLASVCCLNGMVKIINAIDNLIQSAKAGICSLPCQEQSLSKEGKLLQDGIINGSMVELRFVLGVFINLVASRWHSVQSIETFGRGGPAPGVGIGWGAPGGGFWSKDVLLVQTDARFLIDLLEIFQEALVDTPIVEGTTFDMQRFNSALGLCLTAGPKETVIEKALDVLLHVSVLKYLDLCIRQVFRSRSKAIRWQYEEEDYLHFSKMLSSHFRRRWLSVKVKSKPAGNSCSRIKTSRKDNTHLDTIYEESTVTNPSHTSLVVEWAYQRLPLPIHFYLSPISTIFHSKQSGPREVSSDFLEVSKSGLFFILGVEAMSNFQGTIASPVQHVSLTWKLHSLSVNVLVGMEVLEQEQSRETFEALQDLYGELLDKARFTRREGVISDDKTHIELLRFRSEIHESYSTFLEVLVEQFSAISYGDLIFGRQVALYLHRCVESCVRLAAWNALSNSLVLDLLPPLEKCLSGPEGYLQPIEDDEGVLEAYVKSWTSGALDKAAIRGSVAYTLVVHHLSSFIFNVCPMDKLLLRNRLVRLLLRDYAQKQQHEGMLLNLINSHKPSTPDMVEQQKWIEARFVVLVEACEGNSSLLTQINKLKPIVEKS